MCKLIAELVGADQQIVGEVISRFEKASGQTGIDIRLTGEIYGRVHMKMRELGLDPTDTTARELYQSLLGLADLHDQFLAKRLFVKDRTNADDVLSAVVTVVNKLKMPRHAWTLKNSTIKKLLKTHPPKTLMRLLHYRSVESMLKREPVRVLFNMARHVEPATWQTRLNQVLIHLTPRDFEQQNIEVTYLDQLKWSKVVQNAVATLHTNTFYSAETGTVLVTPLPKRGKNGLTLATLMTTLHYINEIRTQSTFLKFHQLLPGFGQRVHDVTTNVRTEQIYVAGQPIHWRIIHRYYGTQTHLLPPSVFEPHIQLEDLAYRKAENVLYLLEPALRFWHDLDYLGVCHSDQPISFNLMDVALSLLNDVPYEQRFNYHMRDALWNELLMRYVGRRPLERQLLQQLDDQTTSQAAFLPEMEFAL